MCLVVSPYHLFICFCVKIWAGNGRLSRRHALMARPQPTNGEADFTRACLGFVLLSLCLLSRFWWSLDFCWPTTISRTRVLWNKSDCLFKSRQLGHIINMDCVLRCSALGWHGCCLLGWAADLFNLICYSSWRLSIRWKPPFCVHLSLSSRRTPWHGVQWYTTVPDLEINTGESISADQPITPPI